jgi:hypothetical protein
LSPGFRVAGFWEFQQSAMRLVRLVALAVQTGETAHVVAVAKHLKPRRAREWVNVCRRAWRLASQLRAHVVAGLAHQLAWIDLTAADLTASDIEKALSEDDPEKCAARLACACGALRYGPKDFQKAKKAFKNLPRE